MLARLIGGTTFLLALIVGHHAQADITPSAQLRQLVASGSLVTLEENADFYDTILAEDFGLFDDTTGLALRTQLGTATADGFVKQVSNITPNEITLFASADAFAFTISSDDSSSAGTASIFSLRFTIDAPALYRLQASGFAQNNATSYLRLSDADFEPLIEFNAPTQDSIDQEIFLLAGVYGFSADVTANGFIEFSNGSSDGRSEMTANLTQVPEPASVWIAVLMLCGAAVVRRKRR
jgi:hypothetical protein